MAGKCARGERVCTFCKAAILRRSRSRYRELRHVRTLSWEGTEMIGRRVWRMDGGK